MTPTLQSHPWIDFEFSTTRVKAATWVLIGEAMSKCEHLIGSALKPAVAGHLSQIYLAKGALATTAIEGNTLSEAEALDRVEGKKSLPKSREYLGTELDNIVAAIREIGSAVADGKPLHLDVDRILNIHAQVLKGLDDPPDNVPGFFREHDVVVTGVYKAPPWPEVKGLVTQLVEWLNAILKEAHKDSSHDNRFVSGLLASILAHLYIAWIHPFGNGNGRTARLVEVQLLAEAGVPLLATNLLSNHYNLTRDRYYEKLRRASRDRDVEGFIHYAVEGFVDGLREQVAVVKSHNISVAWQSYIHEEFGRHRPSTAKSRQRRLMLALPGDRFLEKEEAIELSPRIAAEYARCGPRTPARDLNDLARMGLVQKLDGFYRARSEIIQAFTSPAAPPTP